MGGYDPAKTCLLYTSVLLQLLHLQTSLLFGRHVAVAATDATPAARGGARSVSYTHLALRRILLSSLEGYAITTVKVAGVDHEFAATFIPGRYRWACARPGNRASDTAVTNRNRYFFMATLL